MRNENLQLLRELVRADRLLLQTALSHNALIQVVLHRIIVAPETGMTPEEIAQVTDTLEKHAEKLAGIAGGAPG